MNERYEREAEAFFAELEEEYYRNGAGLKEALELAPIYERYADLFARARVGELLGKRGTRAGRYLAQFAAFAYLDTSVRGLTEEITTAETRATIEWDGEPVPYRLGSALRSREPDRGRRQELDRLLLAVTEEHNPLRGERMEMLHAEAMGLGFGDYLGLCEELLGLDVEHLGGQMGDLLGRTEGLWAEELGAALEGAGIPAGEADISDLRYVLGGPQFDSLFPKEMLLPLLERTLAGLGIALEEQANLHLDTEERPLKSPRAFCCPVRVPEDVRLVIMPRGGREDYNSLFHEAGHAEHFAHTDGAARFAFRCLGDYAVTEGYAFLFNMLLRSPGWLREVGGIGAGREYLRFARFYQLYYLRRYAAKLAYERELHEAEAPVEGFAARYSELLEKALGVEVPAVDYLSDVDDALYCTCYLRAWMLEVHLRGRIVDEFGDCWFSKRQAGEFLKGLWRLGQELTAEELARRLGRRGLEGEPLVADLMAPVRDQS